MATQFRFLKKKCKKEDNFNSQKEPTCFEYELGFTVMNTSDKTHYLFYLFILKTLGAGFEPATTYNTLYSTKYIKTILTI